MTALILGFLTAYFVVLIATPSLIKVAKLKHLVDEPGDSRKVHKKRTPTVGGIVIFSSIIFAYSLWYPEDFKSITFGLQGFKGLMATMVLMFFVGIKDDIIGMAPTKKLISHILVACIMVIMADVRIHSMHGLFGIEEMPYTSSVLLSIFAYIVIVNAYNLIDGVDGLAAGVGFVNSILFGLWFHLAGNPSLALLSFVLGGALLAFLFFNFAPAKVFMGDSGSLTIGNIMAILAISLISFPGDNLPESMALISKPIFAMAVLVYPLIDTLRVFTIRMLQGRSPFSADKNHIHHKLMSLNFSHKGTSMIVYGYNLFVVAIASLMVFENPTISFLSTCGFALLIVQFLFLVKNKAKQD